MRTLVIALFAAASIAPAFAADHTDAWRDYLKGQRETQLDRLDAYAAAGQFPINTQQPGAVSMLRDDTGTPCAMAFLVISSGHGDLIDSQIAANNDMQFSQLSEGGLYDWTLTSGLLQEEAAMVQEPDFFVGDWDEPVPQPDPTLLAMEQERLTQHFSRTSAMLRAQSDQAIELALARVVDRLSEPPPGAAPSLAAR